MMATGAWSRATMDQAVGLPQGQTALHLRQGHGRQARDGRQCGLACCNRSESTCRSLRGVGIGGEVMKILQAAMVFAAGLAGASASAQPPAGTRHLFPSFPRWLRSRWRAPTPWASRGWTGRSWGSIRRRSPGPCRISIPASRRAHGTGDDGRRLRQRARKGREDGPPCVLGLCAPRPGGADDDDGAAHASLDPEREARGFLRLCPDGQLDHAGCGPDAWTCKPS